jgi:hypothetical protein
MKKVSSVLVLAILLLMLGVQLNAVPVPALSGFAAAQQDGAQAPSDPEKAEVKVFTGKVMQSNGQYVLLDSISKTTYALDDQDKAKQFEGKAVKVTGTLKSAGNLIHVSDIEPAV